MYYRLDYDTLVFEVVNKRGRVVCVCNTEQEAQKIIKQGGLW